MSDERLSAPANMVYCPRCASPLETRQVGAKARRVCPQCQFVHFTDPKVGVGVLIISEGRILLVKRAMMPEKGRWSLPAGFIDHGEDPQRVAIREVQEETGLTVAIDALVDVYHNPVSASGGASIFILYRGHLVAGVLAAGDDAEEAGFFGPDELPPIAFQSTREMIARYLTAA